MEEEEEEEQHKRHETIGHERGGKKREGLKHVTGVWREFGGAA